MTNTAVINFLKWWFVLAIYSLFWPFSAPSAPHHKKMTVSNVVLAKSLRLSCRLHKTMTHNTWVVKSRVAFYIKMYNHIVSPNSTYRILNIILYIYILYAFVSIYFKPAVWHPKPWPFVGTNTKLHMLQFVHSNPEFVRIKARPPRTNPLIKLVHTVDGSGILQNGWGFVVYHSLCHYFQVMSWICLSKGHHANFIILHPFSPTILLNTQTFFTFQRKLKFGIVGSWQERGIDIEILGTNPIPKEI